MSFTGNLNKVSHSTRPSVILCYTIAAVLLIAAISIIWQKRTAVVTPSEVEVLAPDVEIHLGDQDYLAAPWKRIYRYRVPATFWRGDFYLDDPGITDWRLSVDILLPNDRGNSFRINGHMLEPGTLPGRDIDWSGSWTRYTVRVPVRVLHAGRNTLSLDIGQGMPPFQSYATFWEDLQIRNIILRRG